MLFFCQNITEWLAESLKWVLMDLHHSHFSTFVLQFCSFYRLSDWLLNSFEINRLLEVNFWRLIDQKILSTLRCLCKILHCTVVVYRCVAPDLSEFHLFLSWSSIPASTSFSGSALVQRSLRLRPSLIAAEYSPCRVDIACCTIK